MGVLASGKRTMCRNICQDRILFFVAGRIGLAPFASPRWLLRWWFGLWGFDGRSSIRGGKKAVVGLHGGLLKVASWFVRWLSSSEFFAKLLRTRRERRSDASRTFATLTPGLAGRATVGFCSARRFVAGKSGRWSEFIRNLMRTRQMSGADLSFCFYIRRTADTDRKFDRIDAIPPPE